VIKPFLASVSEHGIIHAGSKGIPIFPDGWSMVVIDEEHAMGPLISLRKETRQL